MYGTFIDILNSQDYSKLIISGKPKDLKEKWFKIYDEYCDKAKVNTDNLKQMCRVQVMIKDYYSIKSLLEIVVHGNPKMKMQAVEQLKKFGYVIDYQNFTKSLDKAINNIQAMETAIEIEQDKIEKSDKKKAVELIDEVVEIENLYASYFSPKELDPYKITVEKWLTIVESIKQKAKRK